MVPYFLDFHENIRFAKTLSEYQEQPYPLEKTTIVFLDPPKKACNIVGYSWNSQEIFLYSIFPGHYFGTFSGISLGIFQIYWEYLKGMFHEYSTYMYLPGG